MFLMYVMCLFAFKILEMQNIINLVSYTCHSLVITACFLKRGEE